MLMEVFELMATQQDDLPADSVSENYAAENELGDLLESDDDTFDEIDWDELLAIAEDDFAARRFRFISTSGDPVEGRFALRKHLDGILQEVLSEDAPASGTDAARR